MSHDRQVEVLCASLVREYLSRKGLRNTLKSLDEELPRTGTSINSRSALAKAAGLDHLMRQNKSSPRPYRTMLEVMVSALQQDTASATSKQGSLASSSPVAGPGRCALSSNWSLGQLESEDSERSEISSTIRTNSFSLDVSESVRTDGKPITSKRDGGGILRDEGTSPISLRDMNGDYGSGDGGEKGEDEGAVLKSSARRNRSAQGMVSSGLIPRSRQKHVTSSRISALGRRKISPELPSTLVFDKEDKESKERKEMEVLTSSVGALPTSSSRPSSSTSKEDSGNFTPEIDIKRAADTLVFEDVDDEDWGNDISFIRDAGLKKQPRFPNGQPVSLSTAQALREVLFGTAVGHSFNSEWKRQNFVFSDTPGLHYGLIQHKGGPCGVLACVQAYVIKHLLFSNPKKTFTESPHPSPVERREALVVAMVEILWKAGRKRRATVSLCSVGPIAAKGRNPKYAPDGITERLVLYEFADKESLESFFRVHLSAFEDSSGHGCILLLYSVILSREINSLLGDMDEPNCRLMGAHGYCTQELVNLILTGKASSNVFNGVIELDSGGTIKNTLKGVSERSEVGFLSLFEHYKSCAVGSHFKTPLFPVWVISSESHFTVLFGLSSSIMQDCKKSFKLYFYDGLANLNEPVILTVDPTSDHLPLRSGLVPPLNHVIQTRWPDATISWNTEPFL